MQTYLVNLQNNLFPVLPEFLIAIIISCLLVGLFVAARGRTKLNNLRTTLEAENTAKRLENDQLSNDFNSAQLEIQEKGNQIEAIEKQQKIDKNEAAGRLMKLVSHIKQHNQQLTKLLNNIAQKAALDEPQQPMETDIWAENLWKRLDDVTSKVTDRLISGIKIQDDLEQSSKAAMAKLAEKEAIAEKLETSISGLKEQITQLQQDLTTQKSNIEQLENKEKELISANDKNQKENIARISALELEQDKVSKELNIEQEKGVKLEKQLADSASLLKQVEDAQQKTLLLEKELSEKTSQIELISSKKQSADQHIEKNKTLQAEIEQNNAEFTQRLETLKQSFDLKLNKAQLKQSQWQQYDELVSQLSKRIQTQDKAVASDNKSLPKTELNEKAPKKEKLQQTVESVESPVTKLKDGNFDAKEVMQQLDQNLLNPVKDQINTTTEKVKNLSGGLKNFLNNKMNR